MDIYYGERYKNSLKLCKIEYKDADIRFFDWRDKFIKAFNFQLQTNKHKCPRIVLQGEPDCGKTSFVNYLFGNKLLK